MQRTALGVVLAGALVLSLCTSAVEASRKPYVIRIFSDSHIGSEDFGHEHQSGSMEGFLRGMLSAPEMPADMMIMNGDIYDFWYNPFDGVPYDMSSMAATQDLWGANMTLFVDLMMQLADKIPIVYVRGNHDDHLSKEELDAVFGGKIQFEPEELKTKMTWFMHGCQWDLFNSLPPSSPQEWPSGYYITRAAATSQYSQQNESSYWWDLCEQLAHEVATDVIKPLLDKDVMEFVLSLVFTTALHEDWHKHAEDIVVGGDFVIGPNNISIVLDKVLPHYAPMVKQWADATSVENVANLLVGACGSFNYFLERVPAETDLLVLGHTHRSLIESIVRKDGTKLHYANTGTWIKNRMNFVDVEYDYDQSRPTWVRLYDFVDGHEQEAENLWLYAPDGDRLVFSMQQRGTDVKFEDGSWVRCPGDCTMAYTFDSVNMFTLAMLEKAGVLTIHEDPGAGRVGPWYDSYFGLEDEKHGVLELNPVVTMWAGRRAAGPSARDGVRAVPVVSNGDPPPEAYLAFNYTVPAGAVPLLSLVNWWTLEGYQHFIE